MRLIDADALMEDMGAGCLPIGEPGISGVTGDESTILDYINAAPTVSFIPQISLNENVLTVTIHCFGGSTAPQGGVPFDNHSPYSYGKLKKEISVNREMMKPWLEPEGIMDAESDPPKPTTMYSPITRRHIELGGDTYDPLAQDR